MLLDSPGEYGVNVDQHDMRKAVQDAGLGALAEQMGISIEFDGDEVVGHMPVEGNTQPYGILHGGATGVLVETVGSIAAAILGRGQRLPVGIELSVTHHKSASQGTVTARTQTVQAGRTLVSFVVPVTDESGQRIATGRLTCMMRAMAN